jgi:hypothetical protein
MRTISIALFASAILVAVQNTAGATEFKSIRTPSDNIQCQFSDEGDGSADCEITEKTVASRLPPRPADCDLDYGQRFFIAGEGKASVVCAGDTVRTPDAKVMGYGELIITKKVWCESSEAGLTCSNNAGHGFFLSKAKQELY